MKKLLGIFAIFAMFIAMPSDGMAEQGYTTPRYFTTSAGSQTLLSAKPLNGAASTLTIEVSVNGHYSKALLAIFYTWSAASAVTVTWYCSLDGASYGRKTSRATTAGAGTISLHTDSYTTGGASADLLVELGIRGCKKLKVILAGTGAGAGDLVDVQLTAVVGN